MCGPPDFSALILMVSRLFFFVSFAMIAMVIYKHIFINGNKILIEDIIVAQPIQPLPEQRSPIAKPIRSKLGLIND